MVSRPADHPAQELHARARVALEEQRVGDAGRLIRRAVALCGPGDERLRVRLEISAAWVAFEREGLDAALAASAQAQTAAREAGFPELAAAAVAQTGTMRARAGELEAAWRTLAGVDTAALTDEDRTRTLINRGTMASELRRFDAATADLAEAAELAASVGAVALESMARHNLGWVQFVRGDLPAALAAMAKADELDVPMDRTVARLDRARVLLEAGLIPEARELLLGITPPRTSGQTKAELDHELARAALLLGLRDEAVARSRSSAQRFADRGEPALQRRSRLVAALARPTPGRVQALWRDAWNAGDRWVEPEAAAVALYTLLPDDPRRQRITRATQELARSPVTSRRLAGLVALATDAAARGDRAAARRQLRAAHATLLRAQLGVASLDLRAAVALHGEAATLLDIGLAGTSVDRLINATERWRAATRPVPGVRPLPDPRLAEAASRLRRLRAEPPTAEVLDQLADAEHELRTLSWTAESPLPPVAVTLPAVRLRKAVREAGVRLAVVVPRGGEFWAAVTDGARGHLVRLGAIDELEALVSAVHSDLAARASVSRSHPLSGVVDASLAARLQELSDAVGAPLASDRPLVVTPSRALTGIPWLALPALRGRAVTVAPTASSWATGTVAVTRPRVTALGGPDLPSAAEEIDGVLARWGGTRPDTLAGALASSDLVHVAAHGKHRSDSPLFSSLRLDEGTVVAHELEGVGMRASHVVLSACEVGRASHRPGDQPLGLTATLLASGVGCVVAPVAPVGDRTSAAVMARYHEELASGVDAATALARATADRPEAGAFTQFGSNWRVS